MATTALAATTFTSSELPPEWQGMSAERSAAIFAGRDAIQVNRKSLERILAIGCAFETLQIEAMERSHSSSPTGRRYADTYILLQKPVPELWERSIDSSTRATYVQCWQHRRDIAVWWHTVPQNQRDRWGHPKTVLRQWQKSTSAPVGKKRGSRATTKSVVEELSTAVDRVSAAADDIEVKKSGIYDLSTPELRRESAEVMLDYYRRDDIEEFAVVLKGILTERGSTTVLEQVKCPNCGHVFHV